MNLRHTPEQKIWLTSDTHFGHKNIAGPTISTWEKGYRDFTSVEEMNETLLKGINDTVGENDILFHLGDVAMGNRRKLQGYRDAINCKNIYVCAGNHDSVDPTFRKLFTDVRDVRTVKVNGQSIFMSHYAHRIWPKSHHGKWHLYGHSHDSLEHIPWGKSMDVGVDSARRILGEYRPFNFDEIKGILDERKILFIDHHDTSTAE